MMQFRDLNKQYEMLKPEMDNAIQNVLNSTNFILGKEVEELENKLANYVGRKYCISVANGTDALILSLMSYGIGNGDAVFVPDFTYIASASCISAVGATPVFVDVDNKTFNMSPDSLSYMIDKVKKEGKYNLKAIIPVDLFGLPADYSLIEKIAKDNNMLVIEDAAQGFGGMIKNKRACSFGDISCTSFFPAKPLGCYGDGGAIFTDDDNINDLLRSLRSNGKSKENKYNNVRIGRNSRLDTLQAAILNVKFNAFDNELKKSNDVAKLYNDKLKDKYIVPYIPDGFLSSYAQYTIILNNEEERNILQKKFKDNDIPTMIYYPICMHEQLCFEDIICDKNDYKNSIVLTKSVLSLPMHPYMDEKNTNYICDIMLKP